MAMTYRRNEIPLAAQRAFIRDLKTFCEERNPHKRNLIARRQMHTLWKRQRPGEKRVNILDVKELFSAFSEPFHRFM